MSGARESTNVGRLRELALFTGTGNGLLATHHITRRARLICGVEIDPYCQRVLQARMRDKLLPVAPIWSDIRTFDATSLRGEVDLVSGGFPCQAFSHAARGRNNAEDLWPHMLRVIEECAPRVVFAENVRREPIERAAQDLAS